MSHIGRSTKSRARIIAGHIYRNHVHRLRFLLGNVESAKGATHYGVPLERSLQYIDEVFWDYLTYSGLSLDDLHGRRVLEIGPGDNLGVALKFLSAGCSQVVCVDKFFARRNDEKQLRIYRALRESLTDAEQQRFDASVSLERSFQPNPERLRYVCGVSIETANRLLPAESFDFIVSRAVLMELRDSDAGFASMNDLLKPGGWMIHKVAPLQDYRMFQEFGYSPLEFLTVPQWLYQRMVSDCGGPNRKSVGYYRHKLAELNYRSTIHIVNLVGSKLKFAPGMTSPLPEVPEYHNARALVQEIRPRLQAEFQALQDDDLVVEDIFLAAQKPGASETSVWEAPQIGRSVRS